MSNPRDAWHKIIQGLVPEVTLSVEIADGNLVVESDQPLDKLKNLLQSASPESIQQALSWELRALGQDSVSLEDIEVFTQPYGAVADDVLGAIANKSNRDLFEDGIYKAFKQKIPNIKFNLIYDTDESSRMGIRVDVSSLDEKHRDKQSDIVLESLQDWFYECSSGELLQHIASAISGDTQHEEITNADSEKWQLYKKALLSYDKVSRQITVDMGLLRELMFPPRVNLEQHTADHNESTQMKHRLTVNIQHLFNFLSRSSNWVITPSPVSDEEKGVPILFAKPLEVCASKIQVLMYLDHSYSMDAQLPAYRMATQDLVKGLREAFSRRASDLHIRYRTFSNSVSNLNTLEPDQANIIQVCNGSTALHEAIETTNHDIENTSKRDITIVILITDGHDTSGKNKPNKERLTAMQRIEGNTYIIGQGEAYDHDLCEEVANITGGRHVQVDQMQEIMQKLTSLDTVTSFYEVTLTDENGKAEYMPIRVSNEQLLRELPAINEGESITIDGDQLFAHRSQPIHRSSVSSGTACTDQADDSTIEGNSLFEKRQPGSQSKCVLM
jgi:hypothetical protein